MYLCAVHIHVFMRSYTVYWIVLPKYSQSTRVLYIHFNLSFSIFPIFSWVDKVHMTEFIEELSLAISVVRFDL
jgi:hypothetical protein